MHWRQTPTHKHIVSKKYDDFNHFHHFKWIPLVYCSVLQFLIIFFGSRQENNRRDYNLERRSTHVAMADTERIQSQAVEDSQLETSVYITIIN